MHQEELAFVNLQLAGMLRAGIPLEGALKRLCQDMRRGKLRREFELLEADLARGVPLAEALAGRALPEFYVRMVRAGVAGNDLPGMLTLLADYYQKTGLIWTRLKGLMVYPAIVLALSFLLSVWLGLIMGGLFGPLLNDSGWLWNIWTMKPRPFIMPVEQGRMLFLLHLWLPPLIVAGLGGVVLVLAGVARFRRALCWRLPACKEASLARFAAAMALLLKGGCTLPEAIGLMRQMEHGSGAAAELDRWLERCAAGHGKFADLAAGGKLFPPMFVWLVAGAGEDLATGFQRAAEVYEGRAAYRTEMLLYCALPVTLLGLGLMILTQIYPLIYFFFGMHNFMGIFRMSDLLAQ